MNDDAGLSISQFRAAWRLLCGSCPGYLTGDAANVNYSGVLGRRSPLRGTRGNIARSATPRLCRVGDAACARRSWREVRRKANRLHATDAGRPVYARMRYETIATHTAFIEKRFL